MAKDLNKVLLIGRVGRDPEGKTLPSGVDVSKFSIATGETWKNKAGEKQERTTWHNVVVYGSLAQVVNQYVVKGSQIYVEGKLSVREYEKDGMKKSITEIEAKDIILLGSKGQQESHAKGGLGFKDSGGNDDIPF